MVTRAVTSFSFEYYPLRYVCAPQEAHLPIPCKIRRKSQPLRPQLPSKVAHFPVYILNLLKDYRYLSTYSDHCTRTRNILYRNSSSNDDRRIMSRLSLMLQYLWQGQKALFFFGGIHSWLTCSREGLEALVILHNSCHKCVADAVR